MYCSLSFCFYIYYFFSLLLSYFSFFSTYFRILSSSSLFLSFCYLITFSPITNSFWILSLFFFNSSALLFSSSSDSFIAKFYNYISSSLSSLSCSNFFAFLSLFSFIIFYISSFFSLVFFIYNCCCSAKSYNMHCLIF